jgi:NAD(P)-dependent dehydrogenase (short-subunit alcohol dehydrogenase family)
VSISRADRRPIVVTGASNGIGRATAIALAAPGAHLVLVGRSPQRHQPVLAAIREAGGEAELIEAELSDLSSVAKAARSILQRPAPPAVMINNAATARRGTSQDGFDLPFAVNHLAHFLLTRLLLDRIAEGGPARIINVSSNAHFGADPLRWEAAARPSRRITGLASYRRSKAANVAFTAGLDRRLEGTSVTAVSVHPGVVATGIWSPLPAPQRAWYTSRMATPEQGAAVILGCVIDPGLVGGAYYTPNGIRAPSAAAVAPLAVEELWRLSEQMVAPWL